MGVKKYNIDLSVLFATKALMHANVLKTWKEVSEAYYDITKDEIPASYLRANAEKITGKDISVERVSRYISSYVKEKGKILDFDPSKAIKLDGETLVEYNVDNGAKTVQNALGISEEDKREIFEILENDDAITQKSKIMKKLSEDNFLLEYLGYNPNMFYVEKLEPGAWTVSMKLKIDDTHEMPVIVTNDKLSVVIKQNPNVERDYNRLAVQTTEIFSELLKDIKFPAVVKAANLKSLKDSLITQHVNDLHMGGLTNWTETSFDNWDSKKASYIQHKIVDYTIEKQKTDWHAKTLYLVYNGDLFDIDNLFNKTSSFSKHTMQTDSRWNKIFSSEAAIILYNLSRLSPHFQDVIVKFKRGNHDKQTMDALYMMVSSSILLSKFSNINVGYDRSEFLKEGYLSWGKHLFLSDHGELSDKKVLANLDEKYGDLMRQHPYVNIMLGHQHQWNETAYGSKIIYREPSLSPITSFEADETALNGKGHAAQVFRMWDKEKRYPNTDVFEIKRRSVWKDGESDPTNIYPSTMEELQEVFLTEGHMQPTFQQKELGRFFEATANKVKDGFVSRGMDISNLKEKDYITLAIEAGTEIPLELRAINKDFVIDNMDRILNRKPKVLSKKAGTKK